MTAKKYLTANEITHDSFELAHEIYRNGFIPDAIIALWRGGSPIGIAVHEYMKMKGVKCYHTVVKCTSYTGIETSGTPEIENIDFVMKHVGRDANVLVVDDIFDTGRTAACMKSVLGKISSNVKIATLYFKPSRNTTDFEPDFFVRKTDAWIVFPHELEGLSREEIRAKDPFIHDLLFERE